jgi:hypothetical protein
MATGLRQIGRNIPRQLFIFSGVKRKRTPISSVAPTASASREEVKGSLQDDRGRVRTPQEPVDFGPAALRGVSLCLHWRERQPQPGHRTPTDFHSATGEENLTQVLALVTPPS